MVLFDLIKEKIGSHDPKTVNSLILDEILKNVDNLSFEHKSTLQTYKELSHLSLNGFGLKSLINLPVIPSLIHLEIRENLLTGDDFSLITNAFPNLKKLRLGGNPIKDFECFSVFNRTDITILELFDTPIESDKNYRDKIFRKVKNLKVIDHLNRNFQPAESVLSEDEENGFYEESEEDGDYEANEDGEDEFDDDFNEVEEDFELSQYGSDNEVKKIKFSSRKKKRS